MGVARLFSFNDCREQMLLPSWHPCQMNRGAPHSVTSLAVETSVGSAVSCVSAESHGPSSIRRQLPNRSKFGVGSGSRAHCVPLKKVLWVM